MPSLVELAENLEENRWLRLVRPTRPRASEPRRRPKNENERIVRERKFENIRLQSEEIAEVDYRPTASLRQRVGGVLENS